MFNPFDVSQRNFQLSVENNRFALVLSFALLCSDHRVCDWSRKIAPLHQPIEFKTNTNYDLVARVFPRSMGSLRNFNVDFHWLVMVSYFLPSGCCFNFGFGFGFTTIINRRALYLQLSPQADYTMCSWL